MLIFLLDLLTNHPFMLILLLDLLFQGRLQAEQDRCLHYLDSSTRKPLIATTERQLLERHISAILDKVPIDILDFLFYHKFLFFSLMVFLGRIPISIYNSFWL